MDPGEIPRAGLNGAVRILFDLVHPADALFFRRPIEELVRRGTEILVLSRQKDVLQQVLEEFGIEHRVVSSAGRGIGGLARELLSRDIAVWKAARGFRPHVMTGFGGVAISHVGRLTGIPSVSFYDSETATLQMRLTLPFITEWHVPRCWNGPEAPGRTYHFDGYKELSYFHPDHFAPRSEIAERAGWTNGIDHFLLRVVEWRAGHDLGRSGFGGDQIRAAVEHLSRRGRVFVSAEAGLPPDLEKYRFRAGALDMHHLMGRCRLVLGESATMAAEAAVMGVPSILAADWKLGYVRDLVDAGMIRLTRPDLDSVLVAIDDVLTHPAEHWKGVRDRVLRDKVDVGAYVAERLWEAACRAASLDVRGSNASRALRTC